MYLSHTISSILFDSKYELALYFGDELTPIEIFFVLK